MNSKMSIIDEHNKFIIKLDTVITALQKTKEEVVVNIKILKGEKLTKKEVGLVPIMNDKEADIFMEKLFKNKEFVKDIEKAIENGKNEKRV